VKKIENIAQNYSMTIDGEDFILNYRKNDKFLPIPKLQDREDIIKRAHLLGHFKSESTYNFLREKYYWKNMLNQIEKIIKRCDKCHRHCQEKPTEHPAKASEVLGLGDKIGIDLTFGLPETTEGYI
jgi:hypothetical protein